MTELITPGRALRDAASAETMQVPGAPWALAGRLIERMGFPAVYLSGGGFAAGIVGVPDMGLLTLTELVQHTTYLTRHLNVPAIVDTATGFGNAMMVERTVTELESAGAAAIQLADRQIPGRCGNHSGLTLLDDQAMCAKIRAAVTAKINPETVILARTDARQVHGPDAALDRAKRCIDAGADWIFPEGLTDEGEFERFASELTVPLVANMNEFGPSPLLGLSVFRQLGYAAVVYPDSMLRVAMRAIEAALAVLQDVGTQDELLDLMQTPDELYDLLDGDDFDERERAYFRA